MPLSELSNLNSEIPAPTDIVELISYLHVNPRVRVHHPRPELCQDVTFSHMSGGGFWFRTDAGYERYLPINCGQVADESAFQFDGDGFSATLFDTTIRYEYLPKDRA